MSRLRERTSWVVCFSNLRPFGPRCSAQVGDVGVVVGPCDREMHARDLRVCVLWERTKAKNNWQPGRHIELAAEARRMESSAQ